MSLSVFDVVGKTLDVKKVIVHLVNYVSGELDTILDFEYKSEAFLDTYKFEGCNILILEVPRKGVLEFTVSNKNLKGANHD